MTQKRMLEATYLSGNLYAVHPVGRLGTCGWIEGKPWTVKYVRARTEADAVRIAEEAEEKEC